MIHLVHYYSRHYVLEMGLINPQLVRLVTGNYGFGKRELRLDSKTLRTNNLESIQNPGKRKLDYLFLEMDSSKYNYLCDISNKNAYLDKQATIAYFTQKAMYGMDEKKKGFPYREKK